LTLNSVESGIITAEQAQKRFNADARNNDAANAFEQIYQKIKKAGEQQQHFNDEMNNGSFRRYSGAELKKALEHLSG